MLSYTLASMLAFTAAARAAVVSTAATPDSLAFGGKPPDFGYPPGFVPHGHFPPGTTESIRNMRDKIKHVVLIFMENRSLDNLLGGQKLRGLDNPINNGPFCNPVNVSDPSGGSVCTAPGDYNSVQQDPDHSVTGFNMEYFGEFVPSNEAIAEGTLKPTMQGFPTEQIRTHKGTNTSVLENQVIDYYTEAQVPVVTEITNEFVVFNHWHGDCACVRTSNVVSCILSNQVISSNNGMCPIYSPPTPTVLLSPPAPLTARAPTTSIMAPCPRCRFSSN